MLYIAESLRRLRREREMTQEEVAVLLHVSPQSVSKWERGEALPDMGMLPALSGLYEVSVDGLLGMDRIRGELARSKVFAAEQAHMRAGEYAEAARLLTEALRVHPRDEGFMSELAMALALGGDEAALERAMALCEEVLSGRQAGKLHHTARAALCFIYMKAGQKEKALALAGKLPHMRESREAILAELGRGPSVGEIDSYLRLIAVGE